jgi:ADP-ribose pyrophosphatase
MDTPSPAKKAMQNINHFIANSSLVYHGIRFDIRRMEQLSANGRPVTYEAMIHPGAVVLLPLWSEDSVVMIRNERKTVGETLWELPAGTLEPNEMPQITASRELIEETGYQADSIELLTTFFSSPGVSNELMYAYVAKGLRFLGQNLDESEVIQPEILPWKRILAMIHSGEICDSKTLTTLLYYRTFCN